MLQGHVMKRVRLQYDYLPKRIRKH